MKEILSTKGLSHSYNNRTVLRDVNLKIQQGGFTGLVGPNGGGKTTLVKLILQLENLKQGEIELFNEPLDKFTKWNRIGFVSQKANAFNRGFPATVFEVVSTGLTAQIGYLSFFKKTDKEAVIEAVKQVGMVDYLHENIGNLSGGQQQRVFIARSLVSKPDFLILDEPTVGVDHENVLRFYELLADLNLNENITMLIITHDIAPMLQYANEMIVLNETVRFSGSVADYEAFAYS